MRDALRDIILGVLSNKLDKEMAALRLAENHIPIDAYNAVLIDLSRKMKKTRKIQHIERKAVSTRSNLKGAVPSTARETSDVKMYNWDEVRRKLVLPVTFAEKKRMLTEMEIEENVRAFAERLNVNLEVDKKFFWAVEFGCREFIKRELAKIRKDLEMTD